MGIKKNIGRVIARIDELFPKLGPGRWESKNHSISISYTKNWRLIRIKIDTIDRLLIGLVNKEGMSYTIKISKDVGRDVVSDIELMAAQVDQMITTQDKNEWITSNTVNFHDEKFLRHQFEMNTKKWGVLLQDAYSARIKGKHYGIQIAYPKNDKAGKADWPLEIIELDKNVNFNFE